MKTMTIGEILANYQNYLTEYEIEALREIQRTPADFSSQVNNLQRALFGEEGLFMAKEISDKGNFLSQEYMDQVNRKREVFGVDEFSGPEYMSDAISRGFCEEVVRHTKNYKELLDLKRMKKKQTVFVDMDGVLVNFQSGIDKISKEEYKKYQENLDEVPGIFALMEPYEGAIEGYKWLCKNFDTYILSTAPWKNASAWTDKLEWVKNYLPDVAHKRLILSHHKHLLKGDFLIDDRIANGAGEFSGKHIFFGPEGKDFADWKAVVSYLKKLA
ncbi:MAG TPA: hypothetical protein VFM82_08485 [Flavobacteriaceae bacterium]|nr:hypothetical protein [Flavobacteriaceae bacterium]